MWCSVLVDVVGSSPKNGGASVVGSVVELMLRILRK